MINLAAGKTDCWLPRRRASYLVSRWRIVEETEVIKSNRFFDRVGTFNTPSLVEAADSPPFFHNNVLDTIEKTNSNLKYRQRGENYEIAFFYLKISSGYQESLARVDIPMWVARDKALVDELHALLVSQCSLQGRNPYPYALTRADELAYVSGKDKLKLDEMIAIELRKKGINPHPFSAKAWGKQLARSPKRLH